MLLTRIGHRLVQFCFGMFSVYTKADGAFARSFLNIQEWALFNQLPYFEKKHSVRVAKRMLARIHGRPEYDERKITKLGLLHDIGKVSERSSVITKTILVLIRFFLPGVYNKLAERGRDHPRFRRYYIHKHHGAVGAELLARIGETSEILACLKKHDPRVEPWSPDDPVELKMLQEADTY